MSRASVEATFSVDVRRAVEAFERASRAMQPLMRQAALKMKAFAESQPPEFWAEVRAYQRRKDRALARSRSQQPRRRKHGRPR